MVQWTEISNNHNVASGQGRIIHAAFCPLVIYKRTENNIDRVSVIVLLISTALRLQYIYHAIGLMRNIHLLPAQRFEIETKIEQEAQNNFWPGTCSGHLVMRIIASSQGYLLLNEYFGPKQAVVVFKFSQWNQMSLQRPLSHLFSYQEFSFHHYVLKETCVLVKITDYPV